MLLISNFEGIVLNTFFWNQNLVRTRGKKDVNTETRKTRKDEQGGPKGQPGKDAAGKGAAGKGAPKGGKGKSGPQSGGRKEGPQSSYIRDYSNAARFRASM